MQFSNILRFIIIFLEFISHVRKITLFKCNGFITVISICVQLLELFKCWEFKRKVLVGFLNWAHGIMEVLGGQGFLVSWMTSYFAYVMHDIILHHLPINTSLPPPIFFKLRAKYMLRFWSENTLPKFIQAPTIFTSSLKPSILHILRYIHKVLNPEASYHPT